MAGVLLALGAEEEESDAEPRAEQDRCADQVKQFQGEIEGKRCGHHLFSWKAITTIVAAIIGRTLSKGPKWSAQSSGATTLKPMR